jgi:hypothetical protein
LSGGFPERAERLPDIAGRPPLPLGKGRIEVRGFHPALELTTALNPHPTLYFAKGEAKRVAKAKR